MKLRCCRRIGGDFPVIFAGDSHVGEGTVVNVSVPGCEIYSKKPVKTGNFIQMKVLVPGNGSPLSVGLGKVRWRRGCRFGVEFIKMPGEDQIRLGGMVKRASVTSA